MNLYRKNGGAPQPLPAVDYDDVGLSWTDLANNPPGLVACGWTPAPPVPSYDSALEILTWSAEGEAWTLTPGPPVIVPEPVDPPHVPVRIGKFWLFERFSADQERRFSALEAQARSLTPAQIADPQLEGLYQLSRFLRRLDALTIIELDAVGTLQGFELLRLLGVFGNPADASSAAARDQLLAPPTGREITLG